MPIGIALCLSLAGDLTLYAILPLYASSLKLSLATLGILLSANRLIRLGSNPIIGWLSGIFSRRFLILSGLALGAFSTFLYVFANGFTLFLIGRILWGISWSMIYIGVYCVMFDITQLKDQGWGSGLIQIFYFAGLAVNPILGGVFSDWLGFTNALLACTALQGLGLIIAILFLPETHPIDRQTGALLGQSLPMVVQRTRTFLNQNYRKLSFMDRKSLAANFLYMLTLFIGDGIIMSTLTLYLTQRYGEGIRLSTFFLPIASAGGILLALRAIISASAAPLAGFWSDRESRHWIVAAWGTLVTIFGIMILAIDGNFSLVLVGVVLSAWGGGTLSTVLPVIVSSATSQAKSGFAIGILTTSGDLGCSLAPLASYALLGSIGLSTQYFAAAGILFTGGIVILGVLRQTKQGKSG